MIGDSPLARAASRLDSGTQRARDSAFQDIKRLLGSQDVLQQTEDEQWCDVLSTIFDVIKACQADISAGSVTSRKKAIDKLSTATESLKIVVKTANSDLRPKSAGSILNEVAETIDTLENDDDFRSCVETVYVEVFRIVAEYAPHLEHLRHRDWQKLMSFIVNLISSQLRGITFGSQTSNSLALGPEAANSSANQSNTTVLKRSAFVAGSQCHEQTLICLRLLTDVTNCPLESRLEEVADVCVSVLKNIPVAGKNFKQNAAGNAALAALNNVLLVASTEKVSLIQRVAPEILSAMEQLWHDINDSKGTSYREQMLISFMLLRHHLPSDRLAEIATSLSDKYRAAANSETLTLNDIILGPGGQDNLFSRCGVAPLSSSSVASIKWLTTSMLASMRLRGHARDGHVFVKEEDSQNSRKRYRFTSILPDLTQLLFIEEEQITLDLAQEFLSRHVPVISDDWEKKSSWVLLSLARLSRTAMAKHKDLTRYWHQAWMTTTQLVTSTINSRAACFAMTAMLEAGLMDGYLSGSDLISACFHGSARGPPSSNDGALLLLTACLRSPLLVSNRDQITFREKVLAWLDVIWQLPSQSEHMQMAMPVSIGQTELLADLFAALIGSRSVPMLTLDSPPFSELSQAHVQQVENERFTQYLSDPETWPDADTSTHGSMQTLRSDHTAPDETLVKSACQFLHHKLDEMMTAMAVYDNSQASKWGKSTLLSKPSKPQRLFPSNEVLEILSTACSISSDIADLANDALLGQAVLKAWKMLILHLRIDVTNRNIANFERNFSSVAYAFIRNKVCHPKLLIDLRTRGECSQLLQIVAYGARIQVSNRESQEVEEEDDFGTSQSSRQSRSETKEGSSITTRKALDFCEGERMRYIQLQTCLLEHGIRHTEMQHLQRGKILVDFAMALKTEDFLSLRFLLPKLLRDDPSLSTEDATRILSKVIDTVFEDTAQSRNEAAICFSIALFDSTMSLWTNTDDEDLNGVAMDLYVVLMERSIGKDLASTRVLDALVHVLNKLLRSQPLYGQNESGGQKPIHSPRNSLLQILAKGRSSLKFRLVPSLSRLFDTYAISQYPPLFDDIVDRLPVAPEDIEGIAVRLYILAELGSKWRILLSQAAYHVFETAANVLSASRIASGCFSFMSRAIGANGKAEQVLQLLGPQIFLTWLEVNSIDTVPYAAFNFKSLKDLVSSEQEQLVAFAASRRDPKHIERLEAILGLSWRDLLRDNFARTFVYATVYDVAEHKTGASAGPCESALRDDLGNDTFNKLVRRNFAPAIAQTMALLSDDHGLEKVFKGSDRHKLALDAFRAIAAHSSSGIPSTVAQEPSFRAKYLLHIVSKICLAAKQDPASLWQSPLLVYVYRQLFNDGNLLLGSLQMNSTLCKLRTVVAMAGTNALKGYPLEMILHNLKTYLTDVYCTEDAIGMYWYLLEQGADHLQSNASFTAGLAVSIFTSLSSFVASSQESVTQNSQFEATIARAKDFRTWLIQHFSAFEAQGLPAVRAERFRLIMRYATCVSKSCTSSVNEPEGCLLYHVLLDQADSEPLISGAYFSSILADLSHNFHAVSDSSQDILAGEEDCSTVSRTLYRALKTMTLPSQFKTWVGLVLGRAFASKGPELLFGEESGQTKPSIQQSNNLLDSDSLKGILDQILEQLWERDSRSAGVCETALSYMLESIPPELRQDILEHSEHRLIMHDLLYKKVQAPQAPNINTRDDKDADPDDHRSFPNASRWASALATILIKQSNPDDFMSGLLPVISSDPRSGARLLPSIAHILLFREAEQLRYNIRDFLSAICNKVLLHPTSADLTSVQIVLSIVMYLHRCKHPGETNIAKRYKWLDVNYIAMSRGAFQCGFGNASLLLFEIDQAGQAIESRQGRRGSMKSISTDTDLLASIFQSVSDDDFFYGCHEEVDVESLMQKLHHEGNGSRLLAVQSAVFDSHIKATDTNDGFARCGASLVESLSSANLDGLSLITQEWTGATQTPNLQARTSDSFLNVHQWDLLSTQLGSNSSLTYGISPMLRALAKTTNRNDLELIFQNQILRATYLKLSHTSDTNMGMEAMLGLISITELYRLSHCDSPETLSTGWSGILKPFPWLDQVDIKYVNKLMRNREASVAAMRRNPSAKELFQSSPTDLLIHEITTVHHALKMTRTHEVAQSSLTRAMYLMRLQEKAAQLGLLPLHAITMDIADVLWSQNEVVMPINMMKALRSSSSVDTGSFAVSQAEILSSLGLKLGQARMSRPSEVIKSYLQPAVRALEQGCKAPVAGRVYHNFAAFCDEHYSDPDGKDEFERASKIRERKLAEVSDLGDILRAAKGHERESLKSYYTKQKSWFQLDDKEYKRLKATRETLLQQCLENYLLSLQVCDEFDKDVLRFLALWMSNHDNFDANGYVKKHLPSVPTKKLAPFVNQLSSRLLDRTDDRFSKILFDLLYRICSDHPFHGQYQLYAVGRTKSAKHDAAAESRIKAATKLTTKLHTSGGMPSAIWVSIHNSNIAFSSFANEKPPSGSRTGSKSKISNWVQGRKLEDTVRGLSQKIPPPTMHIELRSDKDYSKVPVFRMFEPDVSLAGGISAPKIIDLFASDGSKHKMLVKGGNDDLRQDAIMEQVFDQVSKILHNHRSTRQRRLGIRTYKVIPLTHTSGIIEFVQNTKPLHDWLLDAHVRYFPKDYKPNQCRKLISEAANKKFEDRLKAYKTATQNFHPAMRFFFMENFVQPDEWFQKRLNYSRSTAAISMLGHVLGVGDRHGHNILLDTASGEAVHIDLGVAFEAGRVLPVPETVPFRLTRDIVDGMGVSGVNGPFRRSCEFTMDAMRKNSETIMTILDVLRWDPLHSWSVSPVRIARMQQQAEKAQAENGIDTNHDPLPTPDDDDGQNMAKAGATKTLTERDEPGEADRALAIVAKKLSKSLSIEATVNDLIRQATDENNLAVLFSGWCAFA